MTFLDGRAIETLDLAPQATRDAVIRTLISLVLRELFEFGVMQTDPNFANYRFQPESGRLVLLDFGAARPVQASTVTGYRRLLQAGMAGDRPAVREAALAAGFMGSRTMARHSSRIDQMIDVI
ncbi:MAG: AarF/UbiB family protein, partial [bacterium]